MRLVRDIVSKGVREVAPADFPAVAFPAGTTILFSESAVGAGQFEVTYRGSVEETAADATTLELAAPQWLLSLMFRDEVVHKEPTKLSFTLSPWKGYGAGAGAGAGDSKGAHFSAGPQPMPELPTG